MENILEYAQWIGIILFNNLFAFLPFVFSVARLIYDAQWNYSDISSTPENVKICILYVHSRLWYHCVQNELK